MQKKTIRDVDVAGKRVLVRVDFNVPLKGGRVTDDTRIVAALPTLNYLREQGAKVILMSHLGRPKGPEPDSSLAPVAQRLSELLSRPVVMTEDCVGPSVDQAIQRMQAGDVVLLENTRFHAEEEKNDLAFARELAKPGEVFVNDAFGAAHRAHASTGGVTHFIDTCVMGFLMERELELLQQVLTHPKRPLVVILGGAKVSDKLGVVENLLQIADQVIVGGGMAYTFLKAQGHGIGQSLFDADSLEAVRKTLEKARGKIILPVDAVIAQLPEGTRIPKDPEPPVEPRTLDLGDIPEGWEGLDIGPKTRDLFVQTLQNAGTVVWNGPMGVFEWPSYAAGTQAVAQALARCGAQVIIGGGDSIAAVQQAGVADQMYHICTGGGASLEFLEGRILPGVAALNNVRVAVAAANWKMHKTISEARQFVQAFKPQVAEIQQEVEIILCPPFTALAAVANGVKGTNIKVGGQDLYWKEKGAYTGEVSGEMLQEAGADYVIIGHSERRGRFGVPEPELVGDLGRVFGDTDASVNAKLKAAFRAGLIPILCVGETLEERQQGNTDAVIHQQLERGLQGVPADQAGRIIFAYEPVWSIGTGKTCDPIEANRVIAGIRRAIEGLYGAAVARQVRITYGGSVKPDNVAKLMFQRDIDGGLVGGASLEVETFASIVKACR